jgi:hypothetical protein
VRFRSHSWRRILSSNQFQASLVSPPKTFSERSVVFVTRHEADPCPALRSQAGVRGRLLVMLPFDWSDECGLKVVESSAGPSDDECRRRALSRNCDWVGKTVSDSTFLRLSADCFRLGIQNLVQVVFLEGRPKIGDGRQSVAQSIGVRGAAEERVRKHCNIDEQPLERGDAVPDLSTLLAPHKSYCRALKRKGRCMISMDPEIPAKRLLKSCARPPMS